MVACDKDLGENHGKELKTYIIESKTNHVIVSTYGGFHNEGTPKSSILRECYPYQLSILGYPHLWKPSYLPQKRWFIMEKSIQMADLEVPPILPPIFGNPHI